MSEVADRFRNLSALFTERAQAVAPDDWDNQSPCEGWVTRDVVRHLVEWMPGMFLGGVGREIPTGPAVDVDAAGAWIVARDALQAALDDPETAATEFQMGPAGTFSLENAMAQFGLGDILVHTWDLARAAGLDDRLDAAEVHNFAAAIGPPDDMDKAMRDSGHFGPRVDVPPDADEQTKLLAFMGRSV